MTERRFYQFGPFRLDANCRVLFRGSAQVPFPPKVAETLAVRVQNAGQVVSKEELLRRVWPIFETFARWFRSARHRVRVLRLVFPNDSRSTAALVRLRLENLDSSILDREFPETAIRVSDITDYFELMSAPDVLRQVDELVAEARAFPVRNRKQTFA